LPTGKPFLDMKYRLGERQRAVLNKKKEGKIPLNPRKSFTACNSTIGIPDSISSDN
jgi:hypothetical protein